MSNKFQKACLVLYFAGMACPAVSFADLARAVAPSTTTEISLKQFLKIYIGKNPSDRDKTTRYLRASVDLNGNDKQEVIVYLIGGKWCGAGLHDTYFGAPGYIVQSHYENLSNAASYSSADHDISWVAQLVRLGVGRRNSETV